MGFLNKIKDVFGGSQPIEDTIDSTYVENIINSIKNVPFGVSQSNVLYGGINELAGYHYFQTVVVGTFKLKTHKGAQLTIVGDDYKLHLNSDMVELESEASDLANQFITKIDFEIEATDIDKIVKSRIKSLELSAKKQQVTFTIIDIVSDEEE